MDVIQYSIVDKLHINDRAIQFGHQFFYSDGLCDCICICNSIKSEISRNFLVFFKISEMAKSFCFSIYGL